MPGGPGLSLLSHEEKDALITALTAQVAALTARAGASVKLSCQGGGSPPDVKSYHM